jgi:hypothetical protein
VFIGFGSIVVPDPERLSEIIQTAAEMMVARGRKVLVQPGWAGIQVRAGPGVFVIGPAPHRYLFARCSCVVHHGGSGTTAEGLRSGVPTVIVPFFGDQFFWGDTVKSRGLGDTVTYSRLTAAVLLDAVLRALNPDIVVRCAIAKEQMACEDGLGKGIEFIERVVFPPVDGHLVTDAPLPKHGDLARQVHDHHADWRFWPFYDLKKRVKVERYENPSGFRKVKGRVKLFLTPSSAHETSGADFADGVEMQQVSNDSRDSAPAPIKHQQQQLSASLASAWMASRTPPLSASGVVGLQVPMGHTRFSWVSGAAGIASPPMGHTRYSWAG